MTMLNHPLHIIFNDTLTQYLGYICISDGDITNKYIPINC